LGSRSTPTCSAGGRPGAHSADATIVRFRANHEEALAAHFTQILALCAELGLGSVGTVAVDSTKLAADASPCETGS
jgi:hypothetical protein